MDRGSNTWFVSVLKVVAVIFVILAVATPLWVSPTEIKKCSCDYQATVYTTHQFNDIVYVYLIKPSRFPSTVVAYKLSSTPIHDLTTLYVLPIGAIMPYDVRQNLEFADSVEEISLSMAQQQQLNEKIKWY